MSRAVAMGIAGGGNLRAGGANREAAAEPGRVILRRSTMRLAFATALLCATMSLGAPSGARAAEAAVWQWQAPASLPAGMTAMGAEALRGHLGSWVHAADGSVIGSLDSFTTEGEGVVRASMFFMGGMKYVLIPGKDLAVVDGVVVVHGVDAAHVRMAMRPAHPVAGL